MKGKVKNTQKDKGYGFIVGDNGVEYFFHESALRNISLDELERGREVEFEGVGGQEGTAGRGGVRVNAFAYIGGIIVIIPVMFAIALLGATWRAWWLYPAWAWFLVPLGLPSVTFWHFTALMFMLTVVTQRTDVRKDDRKIDWAVCVASFLWPIAAWVLLRWMR